MSKTLPHSRITISGVAERFGIFAAAGLGIIVAFSIGVEPLSTSAELVVTGTIDASAIVVGFLGTSLAILYGLPETDVIRFVRRSGHFERIVTFTQHALFVWIALLSLDLVWLFLPKNHFLRPWVFVVVTVTVFSGIATLIRTTVFHSMLLKRGAKLVKRSDDDH